jgi:CRISPR-associated endonuclease/helicase Cas3
MCSIVLNSFEEIAAIDETKPILSILKERDKYLAHTQIDKLKETIEEHLKLVITYFIKLVDAHHLDEVVNNLIIESLPSTFQAKIKIGNLVKNAFYKTILYHDFGKINHKFQRDKMDNPGKDFKIVQHTVGSQHSIISAYIYLIHELNNEDLKLSNHEEVYMDTIISALAYPILRHHSRFLNRVMDIDFQGNENYFKEYLNLFDEEEPTDINLLHSIINDLETTFKQFDDLKTNLFPIFSLIKLNFSLITAPDYYATGEYMQDLKVDNFGLIDGEFKNRIIQNFKTIKPYNRELFEKTESLKNFPFENMQTSGKENLNLLRQKLGAEALTNIQQYKNDNLFYLEAPTGSGKTNISLAITIKLLEENPILNKIFYVFPFTTLITQTFKAIKEALDIDNENIIQLHSKSGFHRQNEESNDGNYGANHLNFLNNHFVNYPITLLTHIKFFDILKGNDKETNYIFHRLSNSIVIIDELQSYNPKHWDKIIYFLSNYAELFNMKIILMSATLPKIDNLLSKDSQLRDRVRYLINPENKSKYFQNINFAGSVTFDFSILDKYNWKRPQTEEAKNTYLNYLMQKVYSESEGYAQQNNLRQNSVRTLIEFITKKSASAFFKLLQENEEFCGYKIYLISGEILDPRRNHIINAIKSNKDEKVILITTQVIEAGVDIDMDLGFKDRSLIDSDEQLAGRVNRNAEKKNCKVFMFDYDGTSFIYKGDKRLKVEPMYQKKIYMDILKTKDFDTNFYNIVHSEITKINESDAIKNLSDYKNAFKRFNFSDITKNFKLIEQENESVFVPLSIPKEHFSEENLKILNYFEIPEKINGGEVFISGKDVWEKYVSIVNKSDNNYLKNQSQLKQIYGLLSKFMFSTFSNQIEQLKEFTDYNETLSNFKQYGIYYLSGWKSIYNYESGLDVKAVKQGDVFL